MGFKGGPAPNTYNLPGGTGHNCHDVTKLRVPAYTMRIKLDDRSVGLGPGMYNLKNKTRFGCSGAPSYTMATKLPELYDYCSPGPVYYYPEKYCNAKQNPPKFTMAKKTPIISAKYAPAPNVYKLPPTLGPGVPHKPCKGVFTMGLKLKTPRSEGIPAPNRYGPVQTCVFKPARPKYTMGKNTPLVVDKTQKPAPNSYYPKLKDKGKKPMFSFGKRDRDSRIVYLTLEDIRQ
ncbi:Outer dense fiber protein 3-like protein 2 [Homalodisca vitripennis]|nr:Outer dense fiber protein 3-like protein 2 [Homalodisca vitripennis]